MKRRLLLSLLVLGSLISRAQNPDFYNSTASASVNAYPLNSTIYNKAQWVFGPNEFNANGTGSGTAAFAGNITKLFLRLGNIVNSAAVYSNFSISLSQNIGTNTTFGSTTGSSANFTTGMIQCFSTSSYTFTGAVANSWYGINLTTPFTYNPNLSLVVELKVAGGTGNQIRLLSGAAPQRIYGGYAASSGTNGAGTLSIGFNLVQSTLPVTITQFNGTKNGTSDLLSWTTSSELNNASFNLQYATDGTHFTTIDKITSKAVNGNSATSLNYEASNMHPQSGHNYYRLEQIDIDGHSSIDQHTVDLYRGADGHEIVVYPNPVQHTLFFDLQQQETGRAQIRFTDLNGKVVKVVMVDLNSGMNHIPVNFEEMQAGEYMVQLTAHDQLIYSGKLTKE